MNQLILINKMNDHIYQLIYNNNLEYIKYINDDNINLQNDMSYTVINLASKFGNYDVVKLLIDKKADITIVDVFNKTPLENAKINNHHKIYRYLYKLSN